MNIENFIKDISYLCDAHSPEGRTDRFKLMMDVILTHIEGNICEIGCGFGLSTKVFLEAAKQHDRNVLAIDPFEDPVYPYEEFWERVKSFDNLFLFRHASRLIPYVSTVPPVGPWAFAFVDGAQLKDDVAFDLEQISGFGTAIIRVDDINRETPTSQVPEAVKEFLKLGTYRMIETRPLIECYLIKI